MRPVPDDRADERAHATLFGQEKGQEALLSGVSVQIPMTRDHPGTFPFRPRERTEKVRGADFPVRFDGRRGNASP